MSIEKNLNLDNVREKVPTALINT
ncbi:hypothetical protein, partial [Campylobacter jejuni]